MTLKYTVKVHLLSSLLSGKIALTVYFSTVSIAIHSLIHWHSFALIWHRTAQISCTDQTRLVSSQ